MDADQLILDSFAQEDGRLLCVQCGLVDLDGTEDIACGTKEEMTLFRLGHIVSDRVLKDGARAPKWNFIPICAACNGNSPHNQLARWAETDHARRLPAFLRRLWKIVGLADAALAKQYGSIDLFLSAEYDLPYRNKTTGRRPPWIPEFATAPTVIGLTDAFWAELEKARDAEISKWETATEKRKADPTCPVCSADLSGTISTLDVAAAAAAPE